MGKNRISTARCVDRTVHFNQGAFLAEFGACFKRGSGDFFGSVESFGQPTAGTSFESWLRMVHDGVTADEVSIYLLHHSLLSKFCDDNRQDNDNRRSAAIRKWVAAEVQCFQTNQLFSYRDSPEWRSVQPYLFTAARKISRVLGQLDWEEVSDGFAFGPGATCRLGRRNKALAHKFSGTPETTLDNLALAIAAISAVPRWYETSLDVSGNCVSVRNFNKIVTVPKNSKTDRVISIEPDMNIYVQKGFGKVIRNRLRRVGINLDDQGINQSLAKEGSVGDPAKQLATIDLSSASDTVSYELVKDLLPEPWFTALEQCRTPSGVLPDGKVIPYQKFSSMGNGYTFELESLIFWALASAVTELTLEEGTPPSVYGDDIILDVRAVPQFLDVLRICGFSTNSEKSWWDTPYRESCGKHYFYGRDVTPFFLRRPVKKLSDLFLLHNNIVRWAERNSFNRHVNHYKLQWVLSGLRELAPTSWKKPRIPDGVGDGAFIGTFDQCVPSKARKGWDGWEMKVMMDVLEVGDKTDMGCVLAFLSKRGDIDWDPLNPKTFPIDPWVGRTERVLRQTRNLFVERSAEWPWQSACAASGVNFS